jgi:hypothetical protein
MKCRPVQSAPKDPGSQGKEQNKSDLTAHAMPVHEDERKKPPNRKVVQTGIAQNALAKGLSKDLELFHEQYQNGQGRD